MSVRGPRRSLEYLRAARSGIRPRGGPSGSYDRTYLADRRKGRVPAVVRCGGGARVDHVLECVEIFEIVATAKRYRYALRDELSGTSCDHVPIDPRRLRQRLH